MANKNSSDLDRAVEQHRAETEPQQAVLPVLLPEGSAEFPAPAPRRPGRPPGTGNLRTEQIARIYRARHGDPLEIATEIGAKDVLDQAVVVELSRTWGCTRLEAVKLWATINADANRYHHQQMPRAVVLNPGAPGGDRVLLEVDGVYQDVTAAFDDRDDTDRTAP